MLLSMPFFDECLRRVMKQATDVFNDWAHRGKDEGMERGHSPAVNEMLEVAFQRVNQGNQPFSFAIIKLVCPPKKGNAMAEKSRSLSDSGFRVYAAANSGQDGYSLFQQMDEVLSHR